MPFITVVVPVRNEGRSIDRTLRSVLTQDYPTDQFEVVVADGLSTDDTVPVVRRLQSEFSNLRLVYNAGRLSSCGRNLGVRHMRGDVIVVIDGHCHVPDRKYIRNLAVAFAESGADCLGRPQPLDIPDPTPFQQAVAVARRSRLGHNPDSDIYSDRPKFVNPQSTAVAYRPSVFHQVGLFDERFDACEDVELNTRVHQAGLSCYFTPAVKLVYQPRQTIRGLFVQLSRYGAGRAKLAGKHPRSLTLPALVPPMWVVWLAVGVVASLMMPVVAWLYLASILLYASVLVGAMIYLGRGLPAVSQWKLPGVFLGIHFGFAAGFLREAGRRRRPC